MGQSSAFAIEQLTPSRKSKFLTLINRLVYRIPFILTN
ncbi:Unknown protein sequence [Pseudomonas syringae pv. maculicola]|nr:Unknown protein sequence [Pseudomonas syringae pv. maculicola]